MADVNISKYRASVVREGATPSSPGFVVSEGQDPVNPPGTNNFVPYSGAISNVELGEFGLETGFVTLDTTPTNIPVDQGAIYWDDARSTAVLIMNGTLQHIGQDTFFYVKNSSGSTIPKGTCVRFAGTEGASGHLLIVPFLANGSVPSTYFMGVTAEEITNGSFGQVMHFGELTGIDTSGFTAGALLYASSTVAGAFQTTAPTAPNNIVLVAAAVNSKNNGAIVVRPTYGSNINDDEGVKITSPTTGQLLQLQASGLWENKSLAQVLGGTSSQFVKGDGSLDSTSYQPLLTNPVTGTGTTNYLPKFTGSTTIGNSNLINDASGNLGLGVTPSAWGAGQRAFDFGTVGSIETDGDAVAMSNNRYFDGGANRYKINDFASIFVQVNGSHIWYNAPIGTAGNAISFTQAMTLNSSGRLLLGTTSDNGARLQVSGAATVSGLITGQAGIYQSNASQVIASNKFSTFNGGATDMNFEYPASGSVTFTNGTPRLTIASTGAATFSSSVMASGNGFFGGATAFAGLAGGIALNGSTSSGINFRIGDVLRAYVYVFGTGTTVLESTNGNILLSPNGSPALTATPSGNVGIGTASPSYTLDVVKSISGDHIAQIRNSSSNGFGLLVKNGDNTKPSIRVLSSADAIVFDVYGNGKTLTGNNTDNGAYNLQCNGTGVWGAGAYVNGSDRNIKDNISTIEKGLEYIEKMNPVRFKYKPNYTRDHTMQTGFIAQELQEVFANEDYLSGLVQNGVHLSVAYQNLLPILVKAIQELNEKIK